MDAAQAISLVVDWIRSRGLDYPTEDLEADRFDAGWSVYAPVTVDESDPMAFLDMPVGRSVFLVGDSGRIVEESSSTPPYQAIDRFMAAERAATRPAETVETSAREASRLIEPIVQRLAQLGPSGWDRFSVEFAFTVSAEVARLRFFSADGSGLVPVPESIAELVRRQREVSARMPAGPWWRLLLNVTDRGETSVEYDYGDQPFPDDQLLSAEHYRNDLDTYPRPRVPVWLAGYVAGPAAQGRDPHQAGVAAAANSAAGRTGIATTAVPALRDIWARWAVLSAAYAGVRSGWGPRIFPGYGWYESDHRSGSTLFPLSGQRAVLSGGKWNSALLDAAYNGGEPLPDLYTGAPAWVNDSVLNTRNRNGLVTFCLWWAEDEWRRGGTDTSGELDGPLPPISSPGETVRAMARQTGPATEDRCAALLTAATNGSATPDDVAALFTGNPGADVHVATNQLSLAGLLAA